MLLIGLALAALPAPGQSPANGVAAITLYSDFKATPPPAVLSALEDEIHVIMEPIGLQFEWRMLNAARGNEVSVELAVITFRGRCDVADMVPVERHPGALGWTHMSDGVILPFSDVDCDSIRGFLQADLLRMKAGDRDEAYGRAVGRVLAHELYHIFANTEKHGTSGVAKATYSVHELLSRIFQFEGRASAVLRSGRSKGVMQASLVSR
jgi:hypothetical protein